MQCTGFHWIWLDEIWARIKTAGRNINSLRYADHTTLMAESDEKLNSLLMRVKEESKKVGLKLNIQKWYGIWSHHFMANRRGKSRSSDRFSFLRLQNHWAQWLQPWNLKMSTPWKESYDKTRQRIKKQTHYFADKGLYSQSYGFSSSHIWCDSWTIRKAEG